LSHMNHFIPVPLCRQAADYTCGVACLQSVLGFYLRDFRQDVLMEEMHVTREGVQISDILVFAKMQGLKVRFVQNMKLCELKKWIDQKVPLILCIQAWDEEADKDYLDEWEDGHYVVACGYSRENVIFMDPATLGNYTYIPESELLSRWHDSRDGITYYNAAILIRSEEEDRYDPNEIRYLG